MIFFFKKKNVDRTEKKPVKLIRRLLSCSEKHIIANYTHQRKPTCRARAATCLQSKAHRGEMLDTKLSVELKKYFFFTSLPFSQPHASCTAFSRRILAYGWVQ